MDKPSFYAGFVEPESSANQDTQPDYGYNYVIHTTRGHSLEMDDTPGRERIRLNHRGFDDGTPGTFFEMHPDGNQVQNIQGDGYEIIAKNKEVLVKGNCNITINGNASLTILGSKTENIYGNFEQHIRGNYFQTVEGLSTMLSRNDMTITGGSALGGSVTISSGDHIFVSGDLQVDGELTAKKITSQTRVDAFGGISAGADGFVSILGGLAIGVPIALPGQVNVASAIGIGRIFCTGPIVSATSMSAPLGTFGTMTAVLMADMVNSAIFRSHTHFLLTTPMDTDPPLVPFVGG